MVDWDERFSIKDYLFGAEPAQALVNLEHHLIPQGDTLVIADGEGRNSVYLASKGFRVTASDSSVVANIKAKALAASLNVEVNYKVEDFFDINWSAKQYDNIVGIFFQFVPPEKITEVLISLRAATKKGGTLLIHGYTPQQIELATGGPKDASLMYTKELFEDVFETVEVLVNKEYQMHLNEGSGHKGLSALIDFVAKC